LAVLKDKVYKDPLRAMAALKQSIIDAALAISRAERIAAIDGVIHRLNKVDEVGGGHIEQFL
jgi:hypothetical protein